MEILISEDRDTLIQKIGTTKPKTFRILEKKIALLYFKGNILAFEPNCPHFDYNLESATTNHLNEIVCPWHNYRFSLFSGIESENRCRPLKLFPIIERQGNVYIKIEMP